MKISQKLAVWAALFLILTVTIRLHSNSEFGLRIKTPDRISHCYFTSQDESAINLIEVRYQVEVSPIQVVIAELKIKPVDQAPVFEGYRFWKKSKAYSYFTHISFFIKRFESFDKIYPFHSFL